MYIRVYIYTSYMYIGIESNKEEVTLIQPYVGHELIYYTCIYVYRSAYT